MYRVLVRPTKRYIVSISLFNFKLSIDKYGKYISNNIVYLK